MKTTRLSALALSALLAGCMPGDDTSDYPESSERDDTVAERLAPGEKRDITEANLTPAVVSTIDQLFGDSLDLSRVTILKESADDGRYWAFARNTVVSYPDTELFFPGARDRLAESQVRNNLFHELGHVWQHENGPGLIISSIRRHREAKSGLAYIWRDQVGTTSFSKLGPEAQASAIGNLGALIFHRAQQGEMGHGLVWDTPSPMRAFPEVYEWAPTVEELSAETRGLVEQGGSHEYVEEDGGFTVQLTESSSAWYRDYSAAEVNYLLDAYDKVVHGKALRFDWKDLNKNQGYPF